MASSSGMLEDAFYFYRQFNIVKKGKDVFHVFDMKSVFALFYIIQKEMLPWELYQKNLGAWSLMTES